MKQDEIAILMENTAAGFHSEIVYRKGGAEGDTTRVIEPRQLVEGPNGLMVRALQVEPVSGIRTFSVHKIRSVVRHQLPLNENSRRGNNFCTGEIVEFRVNNELQSVGITPEPVDSAGAEPGVPVWTKEWFRVYSTAVRDALLDLRITPFELRQLGSVRKTYEIDDDQASSVHAYILGEEMLAMSLDGFLRDAERSRVKLLAACIAQLGDTLLD